MRILGVAPYYSPEGGGLERYAQETLSRLAADGNEVRVIAFGRERHGTTRQDGIRVRRERPMLRLGNTPLHPGFSEAVREEIAALDADVVVAHTPVPFPAEMACQAARDAGVPYVVTYHAGRLRGSSPALDVAATLDRWTFEKRMLEGATRLIAVSPFVRDHALASYRDRVVVVPPGVDTDRFRPAGPPSGREVLFVGPLDRSYRWKGVDVLWQAFPSVHERVPEAKLCLVGAGDRLAEFRSKAGRIDAPVDVPGRLSLPGLVEAFQRAHVAVLPSTTEAESFGMVLAEANACGRPVVASRIGGIPDFVDDGVNGLLADPGDAVDLADRLVDVLGDEQLSRRLGDAGRRKVVQDHDWDDLARRTFDVLEEATAQPTHVAA